MQQVNKGAWSAEASYRFPSSSTPITGATAVTGITIGTRTQSSIALSWASSTTTPNPVYWVQYSPVSTYPATNRNSILTTEKSATLNNLTAGTRYSIRVQQRGYATWSSSLRTSTPKPITPTSVTASRINFDRITKSYHATINWNYANATNPVRFEIQYSTDNTFANARVTRSVIVPAGRRSHELTGLVSNTTYYAQVRAIGENTNGNQNSDWSAPTLTFQTQGITPTPLFTSIQQNTTDTSTFTLTYVAGGVAQHEVQYCGQTTTVVCNVSDADNATNWSASTVLTASPFTQSSYTGQWTPSSGAINHYFRIRAKRGTETSAWTLRKAE